MFCSKCGYALADDAKFCSKCGSAVENVHTSDTVTRTVQETEAVKHVSSLANDSGKRSEKTNKDNLLRKYLDRYKKRWKQCKKEHFKGRKNIGWIAVNIIIEVLVIYNIAMCFFCNRDLNGLIYFRTPDGYAYAANFFDIEGGHISKPLLGKQINVKSRVRIGFKTYEVSGVSISDGLLTKFSTVKSFIALLHNDDWTAYRRDIELEAMPNVEYVWIDVDQTAWVSAENLKKLQTLDLKFREEGWGSRWGSNVYLWGEFPNLRTLSLENANFNCDDDFASSVTDNLSSVKISMPNKYLASDMHVWVNEVSDISSLQYLTALPDADINITHSISDLYGKWEYRDSDGNEVFSITFQDNGYARISDGMGIIGVDLLTFTELDDNTLLLKADTVDYWGDLLSLNLPYELYGRYLYISIYGQELELINYDSSYAD